MHLSFYFVNDVFKPLEYFKLLDWPKSSLRLNFWANPIQKKVFLENNVKNE